MGMLLPLCVQLMCLLYLLTDASAEVSTILSKEGMDAQLIWTLVPPPDPDNIITIRNQKNDNLFAIFQDEVSKYPSFEEKIQVFLNSNYSIINFTIYQASKADAGWYYAHYNSSDQAGVLLVIIDYPDKPVIKEFNRPLLYNTLTLNCSSQSNSIPVKNGKAMEFRWFIEEINVTFQERYTINQSKLSIKPLLLTDKGKAITCKAYDYSLSSEDSSPYVIQPSYAATEIVLIPEDRSYWYEVGESTNDIVCYADCSPKCDFVWYFQNQELISRRNLSLGVMNLSEFGTYYCTATNEFGTMVSQKISMHILNLSINLDDSHVCYYGNTIQMLCSVDHSLTFVKFLPWTRERNKTVFRKYPGISNISQIMLTIPSCRYNDDGQYMCHADMSYYKRNVKRTTKTKLRVIGPPILSKIFEEKISEKVTAITINFCSSPQSSVKVQWFKDGSNLLFQRKYLSSINKRIAERTNNNKSSNVEGRLASLHILNFTVDDFGNYTVKVSDEYGMFRASHMLVKPEEIIKNKSLKRINVFIIGGCLTVGIVIFVGVIVNLIIKRRRKTLRSKAIQRLKLRHQINKPSDLRHESESIESDSYQFDIDNYVEPDMPEESSDPIGETMDDELQHSNESYDDIIDILSDGESETTNNSPYEELHDVEIHSSYTQLGEERTNKDVNEDTDEILSDDESNLADDEKSTSNSDELV